MPRRKKNQISDEAADALILSASGSLGMWFTPTAEWAEPENDDLATLPSGLTDPNVMFEPTVPTVLPMPKSGDRETMKNLAMAAKNGKELSDETRRLMQQDRLRAESESGDGADE